MGYSGRQSRQEACPAPARSGLGVRRPRWRAPGAPHRARLGPRARPLGTRNRGRLMRRAGGQEATSVLRMRGDPRPLQSARSRGARRPEDGGGGRAPGGWDRLAQDSPPRLPPPASPFPRLPPRCPPRLGSHLEAVVPSSPVSRDILFAKVGPGLVAWSRRSGGRAREPRVPGRPRGPRS